LPAGVRWSHDLQCHLVRLAAIASQEQWLHLQWSPRASHRDTNHAKNVLRRMLGGLCAPEGTYLLKWYPEGPKILRIPQHIEYILADPIHSRQSKQKDRHTVHEHVIQTSGRERLTWEALGRHEDKHSEQHVVQRVKRLMFRKPLRVSCLFSASRPNDLGRGRLTLKLTSERLSSSRL